MLDYAMNEGLWARRIRFAEPLYLAQSLVYSLARRPLGDAVTQDGALLNFLGAHFRTINSSALLECFADQESALIRQFVAQKTQKRGLIVNDDMRYSEEKFLRSRNYTIIKISAPEQLCESRRRRRGDVLLGTAEHSTERGIRDIRADFTVLNSGTMQHFAKQVIRLVAEL